MNNMKIDSAKLDFLYNWRNRTKSWQRLNLTLFITVIVVTFAICFGFFIWFQNQNHDRIVNNNMKYIEDSAIQETNQIEREMKNAVKNVANLAIQFATLQEVTPEATVKEQLDRLMDKSLFDRIAYVDENGIDTSQEGVTNVSDREYFKKGMRGWQGWESVDKSRVTGKHTIVFYAPIIKNKKIKGVMAGFYEDPRMETLFSYDLFNYAPETYLLRKDGNVIASSKGDDITENMLKVLAGKKFNGDVDYQRILDIIDSEDRTLVSFNFSDASKTYVGVISQFRESDGMVLSILPYNVTSDMVTSANRTGYVFIGVIVATFLIATIFIMVSVRRMNRQFVEEMSVAVDSLEKTMAHEKYQLSIVQSLANIYSSVYYVDRKTGSYHRLREEDSRVMVIPDRGEWATGVETYCEQFVGENYREKMADFMKKGFQGLDLAEGQTMLTMEYQRSNKQWRRAMMIPVYEEEAEDKTNAFVFVVQKIDVEKKMELDTRRALEEAYEAANLASDAKTRFLSNMSHDIRTPMNAIVGMTAIASANLDNPDKISHCLQKITTASKHLLGLINEILDMSKIESGKVDLYEEEFSLSQLIDDMVSLNMPLVNEKSHSLIVTVKNVIHEKVIGDSTRLQQVLTNLLTNAIKYTPKNGKIEIIVTEKETNKPLTGWYEIAIKDNGIGMTKEFMQKIFEPFARAADDRLASIQGTGLGMPIARNIVRMMNGDIMVESELNKGSTFTVSFALKLYQDAEVDYENFVDLPVLVVDDEEDACESTCSILDSLKMDSQWTTSGQEAIRLLVDHHQQEKDFYAVILDWKMPDMDGVEVARCIRKEIGDEIPIVILSAYDWTDIEKEAREAGVDAFVSKPLFRSKIIDLFQEMLRDDNTVVEKQDDIEELKQSSFEGKRILLVEDNEVNREIAIELMSMLGFEIESAENGEIAIHMFEGTEPGYYDIILMDIQMPVLNGYEATKAIRKLDRPDAGKIPIVAMTANAFSTDVRQAYDAGMNGHLSKPVDLKNVANVLKEKLRIVE